jgi:hypothetical protein
MRKVKYIIDDIKWFQQYYKLSDEETEKLFGDKESFKVIYTLYGEGKTVDRYELTDFDGNKVQLSSLNGYERGVVLNDCYAHFAGSKTSHNEKEQPSGVISIEETTESEEIYVSS